MDPRQPTRRSYPRLPSPLPPRTLFALDGVATVFLALLYGLGFHALSSLRGPHWADAAVISVAVLPAAARRRWPRTSLGLVVIGAAVASALSAHPAPPLAAAFVIYLIPVLRPGREARWLLAGALAGVAAGLAAFAGQRPGRGGDALGALVIGALLVGVAWLLGYVARERAQWHQRESADRAHRAVGDERLAIARELHDVVAHALSLIAVQAGVGNYVAHTQPEVAADALASIERTSRGALDQIRAALTILRTEENPLESRFAPAPGLTDLPALVERSAQAQMRVDLTIHGQPQLLPAGLELAAYRVIQEGITNVIRHAATDCCRVSVTYQPGALVVSVTDQGAGEAAGAGGGYGLVGMRERVALYGGELCAAPLPGAGFQVTARFPLGGEVA